MIEQALAGIVTLLLLLWPVLFDYPARRREALARQQGKGRWE